MVGAPISLNATIMAHDDKRLLVRGQLFHAEEGFLSAETEGLFLSVSLAERRVAPWPADISANFAAFQAAWPDATPPQRLALKPRAPT
jgi:acyl-CoA thioester hydrolase